MPNPKNKTVAIIGRPNVGKSALFNRLAGHRIAIVHDQPGVTRDRIEAICTKTDPPFRLWDTGGIGQDTGDPFAGQVELAVNTALETADIILWVVDAQAGCLPLDLEIAEKLRRTAKPIHLLVNKIDHPQHEPSLDEFYATGLPSILGISAAHGRGISSLLRVLQGELRALPATQDDEEVAVAKSEIKVAILGRPNVGKSSLLNAILGETRALVSDLAGTTRDALDIVYQKGKNRYLLIDTAGLRKKMRRDSAVETFSAFRTERSIRRSDICLLVLDAAAGVTSQDRRIARLIVAEEKPCIIVANKFDLFHPHAERSDRLAVLKEDLTGELLFLSHCPLIALSALRQTEIGKLFRAIDQLKKSARARISTGVLNRELQSALSDYPPPQSGGRRLKVFYGTLGSNPESAIAVPRIILFVNDQSLVTDPYQRYLEKRLRAIEPFTGLPLVFEWRQRPKDVQFTGKGRKSNK